MVDNALIVNLLGENSQSCMHYAEPVARLQRVVLTHRTSSEEPANLRRDNQGRVRSHSGCHVACDVYEQRTWRDGNRVRTQSRYVGPAQDSGARAPDPILGSVVVGPVWRAESGYRHQRGATAWDVICYESEDFGNAYLREQVESVCRESDLRNHAAHDLVWVTATAKIACRYGSNVSQFDLPAGSRIIAMDRDD
jgi:hypothetical protein